MSVPKGKRSISAVKYFDQAYELVETLTKFLISDFGTKKTYNNLYVFTNKAKMNENDKEEFKNLVEKYHLDIETAYSYWLIEHYRDIMLNLMHELIKNISHANTMYPNSVYEFNIRRQYQTDAISNCYDLKHTLQLAIKIFPVNLKKYILYVKIIDDEINYLKGWRKESNKFKRSCYDNDEKYRKDAMKRAISRSSKQKDGDFIFNLLANDNINISTEQLIYNLNNVNYYINSNGQLCADRFVPAITFVDINGNIIGDGVNS